MVTEKRLKKFKSVVANRQKDIVVVCEDIYDPHNAQAVFRTCEAFGIQHIHLIFINQKQFNPKKIGKSSSSSANKWLNFTEHFSTESCLSQLKKDGYTIYATALSDNTPSIYNTNFQNKKIALLLGNEHDGLTKTALSMADKSIMIPMQGMIQSLNLSVSAAIFLYEISRQRQTQNNPYLLPQTEQEKLLTNYLDR